ncbi:hypothetical protein Mlab_0474 [Methanocorpusculum labreanum Z]|uniref:Zinc ribbon domain-containing protein n=1 Tax=Methanocorpusculum labreanum (strain ATCC 43576 / DSM 4855 / Z) TaxID=410358 RepID=A2SQP2_METLZ|nr:hypothetical protein [Methanocorpusculum labreanum]ABN06648.1 hypothetical protein Mlab_0474 [Methanocorpusculum labreanum Z]
MPDFQCPKCGAALQVKPGTQMATCSFCGTVTYIDRSSALFFYLLPFSINEGAAKGIFKRWTAGPAQAKDLESAARITKLTKEFFPVFRFRRTINGRETVFAKPAKGTLLPGMQDLTIPPGNVVVYDAKASTGDADVIQPDIAIDSYLPELAGTPIDQALVYFPIYEISYEYQGASYQAVIDGSSGAVYTTSSPTRSSSAYIAVMGLAFTLGLLGSILGVMVNPIFFVLIIAGFFAGKLLAGKVVERQKPAKEVKAE